MAEKPLAITRRTIGRLVGFETFYTFLFERTPQLWRATPPPLRATLKAGMWYLSWQGVATLAWFRGWIDRTLPSYLVFSLVVGAAIVLGAALIRAAIVWAVGRRESVPIEAPPLTQPPAMSAELPAPPTMADAFTVQKIRRVAELWVDAHFNLDRFAEKAFRSARTEGTYQRFVVDLINAQILNDRHQELRSLITSQIRNKRTFTASAAAEATALLREAIDRYYVLANAVRSTALHLIPLDALCDSTYIRARESGIELADELVQLQHTDLDRLAWRDPIRQILPECTELVKKGRGA